MSTFLIIIAVLISILLLYNIYLLLSSKRSVGSPILFDKIDNELAERIKDRKGLLYFYSNSCSNCKVQTPIIEKLSKNYESIIKIDTTQNLQTAKAFKVMGIPSLVFFGSNKILGYYIGTKKESFITEKLQSI